MIDVTAPSRRGRNPTGIAAHRDGSLAPCDRSIVAGIPCTSLARTHLDLAGTVAIGDLRRTLAEAEVRRRVNQAAIRDVVRRNPGRRGVARLRLLLDETNPVIKRTRSEMERMFLRVCERAGLPRPEVNVQLDFGDRRIEPDFLWRDSGLIVEADSRGFHDTYSAFLEDRRREQRLQLAGWRVSRCTWSQIEHEPQALAQTIRALLACPELPMGRSVEP